MPCTNNTSAKANFAKHYSSKIVFLNSVHMQLIGMFTTA